MTELMGFMNGMAQGIRAIETSSLAESGYYVRSFVVAKDGKVVGEVSDARARAEAADREDEAMAELLGADKPTPADELRDARLAALIEAYHVVFDIKDEHLDDTTVDGIKAAAYDTSGALRDFIERIGEIPPRRFDGEGRKDSK